jgi:hypothetical protein
VVKPDGPDERLDLLGLRAGERLRRRVAGEEGVADGVDGSVVCAERMVRMSASKGLEKSRK